jgi:hypothetical protein
VVATCLTPRRAPASAVVGTYVEGLGCAVFTDVVQVAGVVPVQRYHSSLTSGGNGEPVHVPAVAVSELPTCCSPPMVGAPQSAEASGAANASVASRETSTGSMSFRAVAIWSGYWAAKVRAPCPSPAAACISSGSEGPA